MALSISISPLIKLLTVSIIGRSNWYFWEIKLAAKAVFFPSTVSFLFF